jgi:hypothetical protein
MKYKGLDSFQLRVCCCRQQQALTSTLYFSCNALDVVVVAEREKHVGFVKNEKI